MEDNTERIDQFFRERLANFEQKPDEKVWRKITSRLRPDKNDKMGYLLLRIAAGMTLLFSLGVGYYLVNRHDEKTLLPAISYQSADKNAKDTIPVKRIRKSHTNKPERKKTEKSDRLQPVRKVYEGPQIVESLEESTAYLSSGLEKSMPWNYQVQRNRETEELSPLHGKKMALLMVPVPSRLNYSPIKGESLPGPESAYLLTDMDFTPYEEPAKVRQHQWIVGGEVAPLYSYRAVTSDYPGNSVMNKVTQSESGVFAYAGGIRLAYTAGKRLSVQSGVYYSRYGQEKNNVEAYTTNFRDRSETTYISISNSTGTIYYDKGENTENNKVVTNSVGASADLNFYSGFSGINSTNLIPLEESGLSATQYFDYLELPLTVKYKIINRKFGFSLLGGLVTNFLVNNVVQLNNNGSKESFAKTSDINKVNYLGSVGLGFEYPVMKNIAFSLEPRFRYYINSIDQTSSFNVHPYSFGVFAGLSYIF